MAYRVIKAFTDGQDNMHIYKIGDEYPRKGAKPTEKRINGLLGTNNKQGVPLIKEVVKKAQPKVVEEEPTPRKHRRKKG